VAVSARAFPDVGAPGRVEAALDLAFLANAGYNVATRMWSPPADHPLFGWRLCPVAGCSNTTVPKSGRVLCAACAERLGRQRVAEPALSVERFVATVSKQDGKGTARSTRLTRATEPLCRLCCLPGHERPAAANGLCVQCGSQRHHRKQSVEAFVSGDERFGPGRPKPTFGECQVVGCDRLASTGNGLCRRHDPAWREAGRPRGRALAEFLDVEAVRMHSPHELQPRHFLVVSAKEVSLKTISPTLRAEVLLGLQDSARLGRQVPPHVLTSVLKLLDRRRVGSVLEVAPGREIPTPAVREFIRGACDAVRLACSDPESEASKDVWDMRVFGRDGTVDFTAVAPDWLRAGAKNWALEKVGNVSPRSVTRVVEALEYLSAYLTRRDDGGLMPTALDRRAMTSYLSRLRLLEQRGELSKWVHSRTVKDLRLFLREARQLGLMDVGQPLHGLSGTFGVNDQDTHAFRGMRRDERRRDLPQVVMDQLLDEDALIILEALFGLGARALIELHAEIGRRPTETCVLRLQCLEWDATDEPVLIYDAPKVDRTNCRLPIATSTAAIITAQQARVRERFPETPPAELKLFPRTGRNPRGTAAVTDLRMNRFFRDWTAALPSLLGPDGNEFDRSRVFGYAFRHTFAQRHADAGTPVEVLADLLGHEDLKSTQGYYEVGDQRKRLAIDQMRPLQLDRGGDDTPFVERLVESQRQRQRVGQVAVTFGGCAEPSNVRASGQACPFRHRCFGCEHFRTDPSYLPELKVHLNQLLADRERLAVQAPELAEWARRDARPAEEEIAAVQRLVRRCEAKLAELPEGEREAVEEAIVVLRRVRAQLTGRAAPSGQPLAIRQIKPTLNPRVAAEGAST
jgi:integrase